MKIRDVYKEWTEGFVSGGVQFEAMSILSKERGKKRRLEPQLESAVRRRRILYNAVKQKATQLGNLDAAIAFVEGMRRQEDGKTESLSSLVDRLCKASHLERMALLQLA